ncbi:MAG TPA: O-acetyl-ADP-ribose deacetylase [Planctomycetota bacterium]|nr:O-acetyl-ADP-ribose deacetylase [Planctomycetota bacterium]
MHETPSAPLERIRLVQGDLTLQDVDAMVNAANESLRGGGGVDGAIHRAAGPELLEECKRRHPGGCPTGQVRMTGGHRLKARAVIHAVGPRYRDGRHGEAELLASCYREAVELAAREGLRTLAFPAISCGAYGYPWDEAAEVALAATAAALARHPEIDEVRVVLRERELLAVFERALERLTSRDDARR